MPNKSEKIVVLAKNKTQDKEKLVMEAIKTMQENHKKITFYGVQKATGVSKSFLYNNPTLRQTLVELRDGKQAPSLDADTSGTLIAALKQENKELQKQVKALQRDELYKEKYELMRQERDMYRERYEKLLGSQY